MIYTVILIIFAVAFAVDPALYAPYQSLKIQLFIILPPAIISVKLLYDFIRYRRSTLVFSIIEYLLIIQLIWAILGNYTLITHPSDVDLFLLISLLMTTFLTRQVREQVKTNFVKSENTDSDKVDRQPGIFLRGIWVIGVLQALMGLGQYFSFPDFLPIGTIKTPMIGTIGTANGLGSFLALALMSLIVEYFNVRSKKSKIIRWIAGGILLTAFTLNGSRGAILALVCSLCIFIFILFKRRKVHATYSSNRIDDKKHRLIGSILSPTLRKVLIVISVVIFLGSIVYFLYNRNVESSRGRIFVWKVSAPMIAENPVWGVGVGRYSVEYLNFQSRFFSVNENLQYAYKAANMKQSHNEYFQAFCESGIIGGILFLAIWISALWSFFSHRGHKQMTDRAPVYGIGIILLVVLFHSFVDTPLHLIPIAVVAFCILGFVPIPERFIHRIHLGSKAGFFSVLAVFILYTGFVVYLSVGQYRGHLHWQRGYEYGLAHRWAPAIQEYEEALNYLPQKGELTFHLGAAFVMNDSYSKGIFYLEDSKKWYNDRNIYLSLSHAYLRIGNLKEAEKQAKTALSMFPDQLAPHLLLGQIFYEQGLYRESKESLLKCINQQTNIQSDKTVQISIEAKDLWEKYYPKERISYLHNRN